MDPPADHEWKEHRRPPSVTTPPSRRATKVGTRYIGLLLLLSFICFVFNAQIYQRFLTPSLEVMTASIDLPLIHNDNYNNLTVKTEIKVEDQLSSYKHIQTRPFSYVHHDNITHSSKSTYGTGINSNIRISFQLHDPNVVPVNNTFNPYATCPLGKIIQGRGLRRKPTGEKRKGGLPPSLINVDKSAEYPRGGRILNFTATISTNLKILQIGDSVGVQLAQTFDEMVGCRNGNVAASVNGTGFCRPRYVLSEAWSGHDGRSILWHTIGGGVSAMWRMTGLLSRANEGKPPANSPDGGWRIHEVMSFLQHYVHVNEGDESYDNETLPDYRLKQFDAVVFRVMHGWMKSAQITHERLVEAIELANELLGAETVVLMTIPFTNNVLTVEDMHAVNRINADIREIARGWHLRNNTGVKHVLVQEYGLYHYHIIWRNAKHIGYNVSDPLTMTSEMFDEEGPTFLYDRLETGKQWRASIAQVCSERDWLRTEKVKCNRNYLISDGMHICPENLATRYSVSVACLLGCVYNRKLGVDDIQQHNESSIRACERECNEQFMSVKPVDESWIDPNTEIASYAAVSED